MMRVGLILMLIGAFAFAYHPLELLLRRRRWVRYVAACGLWSPVAAAAAAKPADLPVMVRTIAEISEIYDRA